MEEKIAALFGIVIVVSAIFVAAIQLKPVSEPSIEEKLATSYNNLISFIKNAANKTAEPEIKEVTFESYSALATFLKDRRSNYGGGFYPFAGSPFASAMGASKMAITQTSSVTESSADYSRTNIQVEGVDEPDIVKTDGKYIYKISDNSVYILNSNPLSIVSKIAVNGNPNNIFISEGKIFVFGSRSQTKPMEKRIAGAGAMITDYWVPQIYETFLSIYDVSNPSEPKLLKDISLPGNYFDARMAKGYIYAVVNQQVPYSDNPNLPVISSNNGNETIQPDKIAYFPEDSPSYNYQYTFIISLNTNTLEEQKRVFLLGTGQTLYSSEENMYIVSTKYITELERTKVIFEKAIFPTIPSLKEKLEEIDNNKNISASGRLASYQKVFTDYLSSLLPEDKKTIENLIQEKTKDVFNELEKQRERTLIRKISLESGAVKLAAEGEVSGIVLNQFSMDEFEGNFRIATTTGDARSGSSENHLYVLDSKLNIVGKIEGLAQGEKIYSTRFMGKKAYLVTFKKVDPLFVLDLSNPTDPKVLGKLKIPGYSDYLHPYDENHLIGIGKDAVDSGQGNFAWYQGLKLSLFDVSDLENPKEIANFKIGDRGSESEALHDHKAFLFDRQKNLLVLPVSVAKINPEDYPNGAQANSYGHTVFTGAYVFNLTPESGFVLRGSISHLQDQIHRSLYIGNTLYTVSNDMVKANSLLDLKETGSQRLAAEVYNLPYEK